MESMTFNKQRVLFLLSKCNMTFLFFHRQLKLQSYVRSVSSTIQEATIDFYLPLWVMLFWYNLKARPLCPLTERRKFKRIPFFLIE